MPPVIDQCTAALQQGHFAEATTLAGEALASPVASVARVPLLEVLAPEVMVIQSLVVWGFQEQPVRVVTLTCPVSEMAR